MFISVDISDYFRKNIFRFNNSAVLTSASLTINNSFYILKKRLGGEDAGELKLESPFDFYKQVKIYIPRNIPAPLKENDFKYKEQLKDWIIYFIRLTEGKSWYYLQIPAA